MMNRLRSAALALFTAAVFALASAIGPAGAQTFVGWSGANSTRAFDVVRHLGLTTNLKLCLDSGDSASYTSGQSWLDLSGNGYDFFRGANNTATTDDPTFNGSAGALGAQTGAYWSFDGGDFFTYDTTNETWMNNIHKDNAKFTLLAWFYNGAGSTSSTVIGTSNGSNNVGFRFGVTSADNLLMAAYAGGGGTALSIALAGVSAGAWNFLAASINETAGTSVLQINGTQDTSNSGTYSSPSASNTSQPFTIGWSSVGTQFVPNLSRMAVICAWEGVALTTAQMLAFFQATRGRFGV